MVVRLAILNLAADDQRAPVAAPPDTVVHHMEDITTRDHQVRMKLRGHGDGHCHGVVGHAGDIAQAGA